MAATFDSPVVALEAFSQIMDFQKKRPRCQHNLNIARLGGSSTRVDFVRNDEQSRLYRRRVARELRRVCERIFDHAFAIGGAVVYWHVQIAEVFSPRKGG